MRPACLVVAALLAACPAAPLAAQVRPVPPPPAGDSTPQISLRPFVFVSDQSFSATQTFQTTFGQSNEPFFGGGLDVTFRRVFYFDVTASRFSKTGTRVFINNGTVYGLGQPVTATEIPLEFTVGYRFHTSPRRPGGRPSRIIPYLGVGIGSYSYQEASPGDGSGDGVNTRHVGYLAVGGVEFRVARYVGLTGDVQYTTVSGVLGTGGVSQAYNENNLGGTAVRFRVVVGR